MMKRILTAAILATVVFVPVMARNLNKSLMIPRSVVIQGQEVPVGTYTIQFVDDQDGQLTIRDGRKEVARLPYKLVNLSKAASGDVVVFNNQNGTRTLSRIEFKGMSVALQVE